jgi:hypothetical protein
VAAMKNKPKFQFGLSTLLWLVTIGMVLLSVAFTSFEAFWQIIVLALALPALFCVLVIVIETLSWIKNPDPNADLHGGKLIALHRSRYFWKVFCIALFFAFCINLLPFYRSYGAWGTDGCEVAGWPFYFHVHGGVSNLKYFDTPALIVDLQVLLAFAISLGICFRDGTGPFFKRARRLIRRVRTWPHNDDNNENEINKIEGQ